MEVDVREFLKRFNKEDLEGRCVLDRGLLPDGRTEYMLRATSVDPLLSLMREHNVTRLVATERNWFLGVDCEFSNPGSNEFKTGNVSQLQREGNVFKDQNPYINPFFKSKKPSEDQEDPSSAFGLERDLQIVLRRNIEQLEPGLTIVDGGIERTVDAGRIDVTAEDTDGNIVVIELKAGTAGMGSIGQILSYMGSIENPEGKNVRGILVAYEFNERLEMAARAVPNVSLKAYSVQFTFQDRG